MTETTDAAGRTVDPTDWRVGVATAFIASDPEEPYVLGSFRSRPKEPFEEIEHDIQAKGIALVDEPGRRLMLLSFELAGTDPE